MVAVSETQRNMGQAGRGIEGFLFCAQACCGAVFFKNLFYFILDVAACLMVKHASKEEMDVWQATRIESLFNVGLQVKQVSNEEIDVRYGRDEGRPSIHLRVLLSRGRGGGDKLLQVEPGGFKRAS